MSAEMQLPSSVTETSVVVNIYSEYENLSDFEDDYGPIESDSVVNFANEYGSSQLEDNVYNNNQQAPAGLNIAIQKPKLEPLPTLDLHPLVPVEVYQDLVSSSGGISTSPNPIFTTRSAIATGVSASALSGAALAGLSLETVLPGVAAALGYNITRDIVESNPDFFIGCYQAAYPWLFKAIDKVAGIQHGDKTYLDSRLINAINEYLKSRLPKTEYYVSKDVSDTYIEDVPVYIDEEASNGIISTYRYVNPIGDAYYCIEAIPGDDSVLVPYGMRSSSGRPGAFVAGIIVASSTPNHIYSYRYGNGSGTPVPPSGSYSTRNLTERYTKDNKTVYYSGPIIGVGTSEEFVSGIINVSEGVDIGELAWNAVYNTSESEMPEGVSKWQGTTPSDISSGAINIVVDTVTGTTAPFYPIAYPPYNQPGLDPITNPDPTTPTSGDQISNYFDYSTNITNNYNTPSDPNVDPTSGLPDYPQPSNQLIPIPDEGTTPTNTSPTSDDPFDPESGGVFNVYNPTSSQLNSFNDWLWVTYRDTTIPKILNNPFDGVISLHQVYAPVPVSGSSPIRSGFLVSNVTANMASRFSELNCGTVIVPERYGNYLDYSPYTKVTAYLPFIGMVDLNADDIIGNGVNIKYRFDIYTGACVAIITVARVAQSGEQYEAEMYHFPGNCAVQFPISGGSQATVMAGLVLSGVQAIGSVAENVISGIFTGARAGVGAGIATGVAGGLSDIASLANSASKMKSDVRHSGSMQGNFGAMDNKTPYLVVRRPKQVRVEGYNQEYGYPAHAFVTIGGVTGYLRVREVNVISSTATDAEKEKIEAMLKEGVFVT